MTLYEIKNKLLRHFIVCADLECAVIPTGNDNSIGRHVANSACFLYISV